MSIIYSYPTTSPTLDDLLIGTDVGEDNATKSFTVQSLVSLINAAQGTGIITDVTISTTDIFLQAIKTSQPGAAAITYTVGLTSLPTAGLETTQFLRGDNQWVVPTVSAGISVASNSANLTTDVQNFNFTGGGVTTALTSAGNIAVDIQGLNFDGVLSVNTGVGISSTATTGNIVLTNTGVTSLIEGGGITLSSASGVVTISADSTGSGSVTSVTAGNGLTLTSGTITTNPEIAVAYTGADTYITYAPPGNPSPSDTFAFQKGTTGVKEGTFSTIPITALTLVEQAIVDANLDNIKNTYDKSQQAPGSTARTVGVVPATQIVTLSAAEYTTLTTLNEIQPSFIYLTTANSQPQGRVNFIIDDQVVDATGCGHTVTTTINGVDISVAAFVEGAVGTPYEVISTISVTGTSCVFSGTNPQILNGTIPASPNPASVTQILTGNIYIPTVPTGSAELTNVNNQIGGLTPSTLPYNITFAGAPTLPSAFSAPIGSANFNSAALWSVQANIPATPTSLRAEYYFGSDQTNPIYQVLGTYSQTSGAYANPATLISATLPGTNPLARKNYNLTYTIQNLISPGTISSDYDISITGSFGTLINQISGTILLAYNTNYSVTVTVQAKNSNVATVTGEETLTGTITGDTPLSFTLTGSVEQASTAAFFALQDIYYMPQVQCIQTTQSGTACNSIPSGGVPSDINPTGFTYSPIQYRITPSGGSAGQFTDMPAWSGGYQTVTSTAGAFVEFQWLDPIPDTSNGFDVVPGSPIVTTVSGMASNLPPNITLGAAGSTTYLSATTQTGAISNRKSRTRSSSGYSSSTLACGDENARVTYWLEKAPGNGADNAQVGDVFWNDDIAYGHPAFQSPWYKTAIGDGTGANANGVVQLNSGGGVDSASTCSLQGTANLTTSISGITSPSNGYSIQPQYQVNNTGPQFPHNIGAAPVTENVNYQIQWSYIISVNAPYYEITPITSSFTNNPAIIQFNNPQITPGILTGVVKKLIQSVGCTGKFLNPNGAINACAAFQGFPPPLAIYFYDGTNPDYPESGNTIYSRDTNTGLFTPLENGYYAVPLNDGIGGSATILVTGGLGVISQPPATC